MRLKIFILFLLLSSSALQVLAQAPAAKDSTMKGTTIEVIQAYKPQVKTAPKPEFTPGLPPTDTSHPAFNYNVPQQTLYYSYNAQPLRALTLGKDSTVLPFQNYLKLGAGNLSTFYGDLGIGSLHGKDYDVAIHAHYLSQKGAIKYQQSALAGLEAEGTKHLSSQIVHANIGFENNTYNYYGYNHDLYAPATDSIKQVFTAIHLGVDMQHEGYADRRFNYHPSITASFFNDRYKGTETNFAISVPFTYSVDSVLQIGIGLSGYFNNFKAGGISQTSNILQVTPGLSFHKGSFMGSLYVSPTLGQNSSTYFLPDVLLSYRFSPGLFTLSAGWKGSLQQNTYEQLSTENPYIGNTFNQLQTHRDEVFGNIATNLGSNITVDARVSWWQYSNLPLFLNDSGDQRVFHVVYDTKLNATSVKAGIRYQAGNVFSVGFNLAFFNFYNSTTTRVWHEPGTRFGADLICRPLPDLTITAYMSALENMYAVAANGDIVKLKSILDIGGNVEYNIIPRLSVFAQVTNLLNDKYQRWLGYQAYGINLYGGLRLKF